MDNGCHITCQFQAWWHALLRNFPPRAGKKTMNFEELPFLRNTHHVQRKLSLFFPPAAVLPELRSQSRSFAMNGYFTFIVLLLLSQESLQGWKIYSPTTGRTAIGTPTTQTSAGTPAITTRSSTETTAIATGSSAEPKTTAAPTSTEATAITTGSSAEPTTTAAPTSTETTTITTGSSEETTTTAPTSTETTDVTTETSTSTSFSTSRPSECSQYTSTPPLFRELFSSCKGNQCAFF